MSTRRPSPNHNDDFYDDHYKKLHQAGVNRFTTWLHCTTAAKLHRNQKHLSALEKNADTITQIVEENFEHVSKAPRGNFLDVLEADSFDPRNFQSSELDLILDTQKQPVRGDFWREQIKRRLYGKSWVDPINPR